MTLADVSKFHLSLEVSWYSPSLAGMGCPPFVGNLSHHTAVSSSSTETPNGGPGFVGLLGRSVSLVSPDEGVLWSGWWVDLLDSLRQCDRRFGSHVRKLTVKPKGQKRHFIPSQWNCINETA